MSHMTVISGVERRWRWSQEQKQALVSAGFAPGACVTDVARRAEVHPNQLYRWRSDLVAGEAPGFAAVEVRSDRGDGGLSGSVIIVELAGASVRLSARCHASQLTTVRRIDRIISSAATHDKMGNMS